MDNQDFIAINRQEETKLVGRRRYPLVTEHSNGYLLRYAPNHPLRTGKYPRIFEHRYVFYETHGQGPFKCKWCNCVVTWRDMHVDHLNDNKKDNRIDNLAASCAICNQQRGHEKAMATKRLKTGLEIDGQTKTLNEWANISGISRSAIRNRLAQGWDNKRAVFEPRGKFGPQRRFKKHDYMTTDMGKAGCHVEKTKSDAHGH